MAVGYHFCKIEGLPSLALGQILETGGLFQYEEEANKPAHSKIKFLGYSDNESYTKYLVTHEVKKELRHRMGPDIFESVLEIREYHIFKHKDGYFVSIVPRNEVRDFINKLNNSYSEFNIRMYYREADLVELKNNVEENLASIRGGFFNRLKIDRVEAASIFGPNVSDSNIWEEFETQGQLGGLLINIIAYGSPISVMLTRTGTVVLYSDYSEGLALELVESMNELLQPYSDDFRIHLTSGRRRK